MPSERKLIPDELRSVVNPKASALPLLFNFHAEAGLDSKLSSSKSLESEEEMEYFLCLKVGIASIDGLSPEVLEFEVCG